MNRLFFPAGFTLTTSLLVGLWCNAEEIEIRKVGLDELVERVLANDLELLTLRGEVRTARAEVKELDVGRDPELRLGYRRSGDRAVPGPYTETLSERVIEGTRLSGQSHGTSSRSGSEQRIDTAGTGIRDFSSSRNFQQSFGQNRTETSNSTTVREITPTRTGERIHETVTETREIRGSESDRERESYREFQNQQTAFGANPLSIDGNLSGSEQRDIRSREVVTRETYTERDYGYNPYEGGDQYSVELRFYPRNPWEIRRLTRASLARVSLSEHQLLARMYEREMDVRARWLELHVVNRELKIMADRVALFQKDLQHQSRLHEAGVAGPEAFSRSQSDLFDARLAFHEARRTVAEGVEALALEAGLGAAETVDIDTPLPLPELELEGLDRGVLLASAVENSSDLGRLVAQTDAVASTLEARKATRIPWLSVISASYDYEERYGGKYRDEYGVMAAFSLPVFSWLDKDLGAREEADLENLRRQRHLLEKRIEIRLKHALGALERAREDRESLLVQGRELRRQVLTRMEEVDADEPVFHDARLRMRRTLLDTHRLELHVERSYARALLQLETVLGMPLDRVFKAETAPSAVDP